MSSNTPTSTGSTPCSSPPQPTSRGRTDPAWGHCTEVTEPSAPGSSSKRNKKLVCIYCGKIFSGGGICRFKYHLAGIKGGAVEVCKHVPPDVRHQMQQSIQGYSEKKRRTQTLADEQNPYSAMGQEHVDEDEVAEVFPSASPPPSRAKGKTVASGTGRSSGPLPRGGTNLGSVGLGSYFMPRTTPGAQPTIKSVLQSKEAREKCDLAISKWLIDASLPFNAVNSKFYQPMVDAIASMGAGYKAPGFHALRGHLLAKNVEEVTNFVNSFRTTWKQTGCSIMADGWTDQNHRTLINFLAYCPRGTVFLKSVDASDASKTADMLYNLFREVVVFVGPENIVQIVTDNASNYVAAGRKLEQEFPTLSWSPCAAHCLNLIMQDIGKMDEVSGIVAHASRITKYVYNHCFVLNLMRKHTGGREILRPAPTRFATNFIALQSILTHKDALRGMVTCREWTQSTYARDRKGKNFVEDVLDSNFWNECATIVQLTEPFIRVLRLVDSDDRPAMGYLYHAIHKAREELLKRFQRRKRRVDPYIKILDARWDSQLHKNLHAAGYWLNPRYQYDVNEVGNNMHTISGLLDVIEKYSFGNPTLRSKLTQEITIFKNAEGDFGRISAISDRDKKLPDDWWSCYGSSAPNLQKMAIRVLSQTCSSSGCERNWSIFEHIHSKKRNRLEHQRLNDLVYVHYNLRLQQRNYWKGRNFDPIDFEDFSSNETWVLEEEPPMLTVEEIEAFRREQVASTNEDNSTFLNDEQNVNLDALGADEDCEDYENEARAEVSDRRGEQSSAGGAEDDTDWLELNRGGTASTWQ